MIAAHPTCSHHSAEMHTPIGISRANILERGIEGQRDLMVRLRTRQFVDLVADPDRILGEMHRLLLDAGFSRRDARARANSLLQINGR